MSRRSERISEPSRLMKGFAWAGRDGTVSDDDHTSGSDGESSKVVVKEKGKFELLPKQKMLKKTVISKKKTNTKSLSLSSGSVNEGASTSNNVEAASFTRPDLPQPPAKKAKKSSSNFFYPLISCPNLVKVPKKGGRGRVKNSSKANAKAGVAAVERNVRPVYNWLDLNMPLEADQPVFENRSPPGLNIELGKGCQPIDFFNLLFDGKIIDVILAETNHYASNCVAGSPVQGWVDITDSELYAFLGIMIGTMIKKPTRLEDIWSSNWVRNLPDYSSIMTKSRFFQIKHHLHFNDNCKMPCRTDDDYNKLYKIEPIITLCTENFRAYYQLHQEVAVDESITRFKGRHSMKQFDKSKPIKRGFKWWTLADSHTGYVYDMKVYTGKELVVEENEQTGQTSQQGLSVPNTIASDNQAPNLDPPTDTQKVEEALGTRAVLSVVSPHLDHKNHIVFLDRFFTSLPLMKKLSDLGIYVCGTIRKDRVGIPDCMKKFGNLRRGEHIYIMERDTGVQLIVWQDKKPIYFINNIYPCVGDDFVRRKISDGTRIIVSCPPAVKRYNRYMNGVDKADQKRMAYGIDRRSRRWPMRLFWHCLDTAISNAFILYCDYMFARGIILNKNEDLLEFRCDLVRRLIGNYTSRKRVGRPMLDPPPQPRLGVVVHQIVDLRLHGVIKRRCCVVCLKAKRRRESFYGCIQCKTVTLCMKTDFQCFQKYHSVLNL